MTSVFVLGQPYWASRIAEALHDPDGGLTAEFVAQRGYVGLLAARPAAPLVMLRVGYRVGGTTPRARAFDAYWTLLRRRFPHAFGAAYWLGTDVLDTLEEATAGTLRWSVLADSSVDLHIAGAPWLAEELSSVGLRAVTAYVPLPYRAPATVPALPMKFTVLTYLPGERFSFYGGDAIFEAARRLPDVAFQVVGREVRESRSAPLNMAFRGWVGNMDAIYRGSTVVLRVPRHDGLGATVIEGLLYGRHVVSTHPLPSVRQVWPVTPEALVDALGSLRDAQAMGTLKANSLGRAHALREFDAATLVDRLRALMRTLK